ncbi:hypothetical protein NW249_23845 [Streptomyces sp. OUCMDZ-4982]|uniref:hypothetical protein n=1 Tax=Streptomyces sp. OUCMDZ-4982 TaxID=2973090 RepID=UPI00215D099D|nr:hypothetical protein [Streptomyces sp. OUCMDZ-4982]MCR8945154.1 hypothetical protein [Streptomyces sp. OUCMDZ-4982]
MITPVALAVVLVPVAAAPAVWAVPAAARYVDTRARGCAGQGPGCRPGVVVHHWHKHGASSRGVGWVYASREGVRSGTARWLVKTPGSSWKAATKWKRAVRKGSFVEAAWGRDGHTGPKYPKDTRVCAEFKGLSTKACVTLK